MLLELLCYEAEEDLTSLYLLPCFILFDEYLNAFLRQISQLTTCFLCEI